MKEKPPPYFEGVSTPKGKPEGRRASRQPPGRPPRRACGRYPLPAGTAAPRSRRPRRGSSAGYERAIGSPGRAASAGGGRPEAGEQPWRPTPRAPARRPASPPPPPAFRPHAGGVGWGAPLPRCQLLPSPRRGVPAAGLGRSEARAPGAAAGPGARGREGTGPGQRAGGGRAHPAAQKQAWCGLRCCPEPSGEGRRGAALGGRGKLSAGGGVRRVGKKREVLRRGEQGPCQEPVRPSGGACWWCRGDRGCIALLLSRWAQDEALSLQVASFQVFLANRHLSV